MADLRTDDKVWLTPKTLGAPRICWREPQAVVVRLENPYVVVMVDGQEYRVHRDNVRSTDPGRTRGVTAIRSKPSPLIDGYEQPSLI